MFGKLGSDALDSRPPAPGMDYYWNGKKWVKDALEVEPMLQAPETVIQDDVLSVPQRWGGGKWVEDDVELGLVELGLDSSELLDESHLKPKEKEILAKWRSERVLVKPSIKKSQP